MFSKNLLNNIANWGGFIVVLAGTLASHSVLDMPTVLAVIGGALVSAFGGHQKGE